MGAFVMGLFVVQLVLGLYQLGYVLGRRNRLPDPAVVLHPLLGLGGLGLWVMYRMDEVSGAAWASFACVALGICLGAVMGTRTLRVSHEAIRTDGDALMAERSIPRPILGLHGAIGLTIVVCTFLVASGVA